MKRRHFEQRLTDKQFDEIRKKLPGLENLPEPGSWSDDEIEALKRKADEYAVRYGKSMDDILMEIIRNENTDEEMRTEAMDMLFNFKSFTEQ